MITVISAQNSSMKYVILYREKNACYYFEVCIDVHTHVGVGEERGIQELEESNSNSCQHNSKMPGKNIFSYHLCTLVVNGHINQKLFKT